jgi:hypothetical protein
VDLEIRSDDAQQGFSGGYACTCVVEMIKTMKHCRVSGAWEKSGGPEERNLKAEWTHFKAVYRPSVWLPFHSRAESSRLGFPAHDLHAMLGLSSTFAICTNKQPQNVLPSAACKPMRRPGRLMMPRSRYRFAFFMQASPQPCVLTGELQPCCLLIRRW